MVDDGVVKRYLRDVNVPGEISEASEGDLRKFDDARHALVELAAGGEPELEAARSFLQVADSHENPNVRLVARAVRHEISVQDFVRRWQDPDERSEVRRLLSGLNVARDPMVVVVMRRANAHSDPEVQRLGRELARMTGTKLPNRAGGGVPGDDESLAGEEEEVSEPQLLCLPVP